ncbi:MAG TPA: radical SAM protein [Clostridiales bacterium]|nr:radical SAM protein [Clostridiales bacterium]HPV02465.1 radical SAM protein [Clostridiales bacterium]
MKIAFASNDGVYVSQHFGHARKFVIVELDDITHARRCLETRENDSPCTLGEHDEEKFERSVMLVADCKALFCAKAGNYAHVRLSRVGVQVIERHGFIEELLEDYVRYLKRPLFGGRKRREVIDDHPCFSEKAHNTNGRLHLPVSPACNIRCRFCRRTRNTDEVRPGVAAGLLRPEEAVETVRRALKLCPMIKVVGIAGPGDTLATDHALQTFRFVHAAYPDLIKCLSTNGLNLPGKAKELWDVGVRTVTVTVNAVDHDVLRNIVSWVKDGRDLIAAQLQGIRECADTGMAVKVNTVLIPGINDTHVADIARAVSMAGAARQNIIPLIPQNEFSHLPAPTCRQIEEARQEAGRYIEQFRHCKHCRADACGIPGVSDLAGALYQGRELETFSHG